MHAHTRLTFSFLIQSRTQTQGRVPPASWLSLPISINIIKTIAHRHAQPDLDSPSLRRTVRLAIKTEHQRVHTPALTCLLLLIVNITTFKR